MKPAALASLNANALELFVQVSRVGSVSRAALELGMDKAAVARAIAKLETGVGMRLFHRSGRGMVLTDAGKTLLACAEDVVRALERTRQAAHELSHAPAETLVLAAQPTLALMLFGPLGDALQADLPDTPLRLVEGLTHQLLAWLLDGAIDIAIFYIPRQGDIPGADVLLREPLCLLAPASAGRLPPATPTARLADYPLILPSPPHGRRLLVENLLAHHQRKPRLALECDASLPVTKQLVAQGLGCTMLPLAVVREEVDQGRLQASRLVDPPVERDIAIATSINRPRHPSQWQASQTIRHTLAKLVAEGSWPGVSVPPAGS